MTCKNCNTPLEKQARFCIKCGARVSESQENQLPATTQQDQDTARTTDPPPPKRVENPIRPPKRPAPMQPVPQKHEADEKERINEPSLPISRPDDANKKIVEAIEPVHTPVDIVDEQATVTLDHPEKYASTPAKKDPLYDQPTIIVSRDSLKHAKAEIHSADSNAAQQNTATPATPVTPFDITTLPFEARSIPHPELMDAVETEEAEDKKSVSSLEDAQPLLYYRLNTTMKGSQKLPAAVNRAPYNQRRRRSGAGCFLGCLTTFIVLVLIVGAAWVFALRPYAHDMAQSQLDNALTAAVNQMPTQAKQLPPGSTVPINENTINNLIVLNLAPSDPVQHPTTSISTKNIRLDFQLYNFPCAVTLVPTVNNGRLTVTQVGVEGIFSAIMSPDEITSLLNKHLNDAQSKLQRTVTNVQLKDHEVDVTLS